MTQTFDLILKGATVVNHDGEGVRDLGVIGGRIAAIGQFAAGQGGKRSIAAACMCSRA